MSSSYYLLGPITSDNEIILVANKDKIAYFLRLIDGELIFDPLLGSPLQLDLAGTTAGVILSFSGSDEVTTYVGTTSSDSRTIASPIKKSTTLVQSSPEVNPWSDFLAGVHYTFHDSGSSLVSWKAYIPKKSSITNGIPTEIEKDSSDKPMIQYFQDIIRVIPTEWYQEGSCSSTSGVSSVIAAETLWITETGQVPNGYTDTTDCQVGVRYKYCGKNVDCGTSCKGPCTTSGVTCTYEASLDGFKCSEAPKKQEPLYRRPWFIALIVVISVLVVLVFFLFLFRFK